MPSSRASRCPGGIGEAIKSVGEMLRIAKAHGFNEDQSAANNWPSLDELFSPGETRKRRHKALAEAVELQDDQLSCRGVQLGQRYTSSAIVRDDVTFFAPTRDSELYYHPTTTPGEYTPHAWIERNGKLVSTIDLAGRGVFLVLTGAGCKA